MALRVTWRDVAAFLMALAALVASVVLWANGRVVIGLELTEASESAFLEPLHGSEEVQLPGVFVSDVVPDGNAARHGIYPGARVLSLTTVDGQPVDTISTVSSPGVGEMVIHSEFGDATPLPIEAIPPERIAGVIVGQVYAEEVFEGEPRGVVTYGYASIERRWLESTLTTDIYAVGFGLLLGTVVAVLLWRGWLGDAGRRNAVVAGSAAALPLLLVPVIEVGNAIGIYATYGAVIAVCLLLAFGLAERVESAKARRTALAAGVGFSGLAATLVVRHMLTPELSPDERGPIAVLLAAIALAPALVAVVAEHRGIRDRANNLTLGAVPALALVAIVPSSVQPALPPMLIAGGLLVHGLPWERITEQLTAGFGRVRSGALSVGSADGTTIRERRDMLSLALVAAALFGALTQDAAWGMALAGAVGTVAWIGVRQGVIGHAWVDAAVPLAACVAIPILLAPLSWRYSDHPAVMLPTVLIALAIAHLLAERHSDPAIGSRLFGAAAAFAFLLFAASLFDAVVAFPFAGLIPLIPAIPVAFADRSEAAAVSWRLETLAVALTPLMATSVLVSDTTGLFVLSGWVLAVVAWRYLALNPLMGLARRTELQRDVAVAAAETERARLAADLHDDALQQLTMLVRTLDQGGHTNEADEAREVATKLRSVVGDLRLPILDDLGAGAALEWLVERVEPLAGGPVKLERSDATRPPANVELAVFRVAQEALNNAIRHGKPPIAVRYDVRSDGRVTLAIDDAGDGIGAEAAEEAPQQGHFGLANMQQRAEQIGGLLDVRRWPAGGTRVALEWRPQ